MGHKTFIKVVTAFFGIVALFHALRLVMGWGAVIGGFHIPLWWSIIGLLVAGFLAWSGFKLNQ